MLLLFTFKTPKMLEKVLANNTFTQRVLTKICIAKDSDFFYYINKEDLFKYFIIVKIDDDEKIPVVELKEFDENDFLEIIKNLSNICTKMSAEFDPELILLYNLIRKKLIV